MVSWVGCLSVRVCMVCVTVGCLLLFLLSVFGSNALGGQGGEQFF